MATSSEELHSVKKRRVASINYTLCIKCQKRDDHAALVKEPASQSYERFLECVKQRALYGDLEYIPIREMLDKVSADDLRNNKASWHVDCYKSTTNKTIIQRLTNRYQKSLLTGSIPPPPSRGRPSSSSRTSTTDLRQTRPDSTCSFRRSAAATYNKQACFFCGEDGGKDLHEIRSKNAGIQLRQAVDASANMQWKVQLSTAIDANDAHAYDIKYHLYCWVKHVQRGASRTTDENTAVTGTSTAAVQENALHVAVQIEFYSLISHLLSSGSILSMDELQDTFHTIQRMHNVEHIVTRKELKCMISSHLPDVEFTRPSRVNESERVSSKVTKSAAMDDAADKQNLQQNMASVFDCAKVVRQEILDSHKNDVWTFEGSFKTDYEIPKILKTLLRWIISGPLQSLTNESREQAVERSVASIAQNIMYSVKSDKQVKYKPAVDRSIFRYRNENPQVLGLGLTIHHATRSKAEVNLLHSFGYCVDYQSILRVETQIANEILNRIESTNGFYIPPSLQKGRFIFFAIDNCDFNEDTADGKRTLHATATAVFQQKFPDDEPVGDITLTSTTSCRSLTDSSQYMLDLEPCTITGNPKPKDTIRYDSFKPMQHSNVALKYEIEDTAWMLIKSFQPAQSMLDDRDTSGPNERTFDEMVPTWSAYNSMCCTATKPLTTVHPLPLLAAPAHEYQTMMTVFRQAQHINTTIVGPDRKTVITLDMALYEKAKRLELLHPDYKGKYIFRIGEFHTILCALRALGSSIENSGIDDAWITAGIYGPLTTRQILEGKHMKRAVNAHLSTLLVMFQLYQREIFKAHPELEACRGDVEALKEAAVHAVTSTEESEDIQKKHIKLLTSIEDCHIVKAMEEFDKQQGPSFKFARDYMDSVLVLMSFIRATRLGLWDLHLASMEELCIRFFARDRLKYAQMVPGYIAEMYSLQTSDPEIWIEFQNGNFSVNKNEVPFCSIGVDHAIEHVNRMMKVKGGISGITLKPAALARFFLVAPVMGRLSKQVYEMANTSIDQRKKHHDLSPAIIKRQAHQVENLTRIIEYSNPFIQEHNSLKNIVTQAVMPEKVQHDILRSYDAGKKAYEDFVDKRVVGPISPWDKMKKLNLLTWTSASKTTKVKLPTEVVELKENRSLFARLLIIAMSRPDVDIQVAVGMYEFSCIPRSLFAADGTLLPCLDKSKLMAILEAVAEEGDGPNARPFGVNNATTENNSDNLAQDRTTLIIDGMVIVQELSMLSMKTCEEFFEHFIRTVRHRSAAYDNIHLVFDRYNTSQSLKQMTRKNRYGVDGDTYHFDVNDTTQIKIPLKKFLSSNYTKDKLTVYLAEKSLKHFQHSSKCLVVSTRNGADSNNSAVDVSMLTSNQEEADTRLILHALDASGRGENVHIMSTDTDVFILAIRRQRQLGENVCMVVGTGDKRRIVPLKPIHDAIGEDLAQALPGFHAFTGSDTTGRFTGRGKLKCWNVLKTSRPAVIKAFCQLGKTDLPTPDTYNALEEFVCRLYCPRSSILNIATIRWQLFRKCQAEAEKLPPTRDTLKFHILRAHYQAMIWANDSVPNPNLPSPLNYGWTLEGTSYQAITSDLPPAPSAVVELVKCGCSTSKCASNSCSCRKNGLSCTELCLCEADEERCDNIGAVVNVNVDDDESDESDDELQ